MRKIGFLISIILHAGLIYWVFYMPIHIVDMTVKAPIIKLVPNLPTDRLFIDTPKKPDSKPEIVFQEPTTSSSQSLARTNEQQKQLAEALAENQQNAQGEMQPEGALKMEIPRFTLGATKPQDKAFQYKPDFLLEGIAKNFIADPFAKGILPERNDIEYLRYLSLYSEMNPNDRYRKAFDIEIGPDGKPGTKKLTGVKGRIDFNVAGLDITPWARKVVDKIQRYWQLPDHLNSLSNVSLSVGVTITVEKSGSVSAMEIYQPSPLKELDEAVLFALNSSAPFPGLPKEFPENNLVAYLYFNVSDND